MDEPTLRALDELIKAIVGSYDTANPGTSTHYALIMVSSSDSMVNDCSFASSLDRAGAIALAKQFILAIETEQQGDQNAES